MSAADPILHDYEILAPTDIGVCSASGCLQATFRGRRRSDDLEVLVHGFRPPPVWANWKLELPDHNVHFQKPFLTMCIDKFSVLSGPGMEPGRVFLIEPLPACTTLATVWSQMLATDPTAAVPVLTAMVASVCQILDQIPPHMQHADLGIHTLVLTQQGVWGLLASWLPANPFPILLRGGERSGLTPNHWKSLAFTLSCLIDEAKLARDPFRLRHDVLTERQKRSVRDVIQSIKATHGLNDAVDIAQSRYVRGVPQSRYSKENTYE